MRRAILLLLFRPGEYGLPGGTHLVCTTGAGADEIRLRLAGHLIEGAVTRYRFYRPPGK